MHSVRLMRSFLLCLLIAIPCLSARADQLQLRSPAIKPQNARVEDHNQKHVMTVKFKDGLHIRLRNGLLTDEGTGALAPAVAALNHVKGGVWQRTYSLAEDRLEHLRQIAQRNLQKEIADLNLQFDLRLPEGLDLAAAIELFNSLDCVELAQPIPAPCPPPLPPDFMGNQVYLNPATPGIGAQSVWNLCGQSGSGVKIADIEYSWNLNHQDLPTVTLLGPQPVDPFNSTHHGTAVLGMLASEPNGWGTRGISYSSHIFVVAANTAAGYNMAGAISVALNALDEGDVILLEQQIAGPAGPGSYVPVEWFLPTYNIIVTAVGNGVNVIEAAANGNQNLDGPSYSTGNGGHWPFLPQNDSGAIIVGGGAAPPGFGSTVDRSRLTGSNYGSTVDLQGWGEANWTTGYGGAYASEGINLFYTGFFGGTSSASAMVAAAVALLESQYKAATGEPLPPADVRNVLRDTGSPQQAGINPITQNIGPRPDVKAAIESLDACFTAPSNDNCSSPIITPIGIHSFSTIGATTDGPTEFPCFADAEIANDVWYFFPAQCTGAATISLCGSDFDSRIAVYGPACPVASNSAVACDDESCGKDAVVSFNVQFGQIFRVRVGGAVGESGSGTMIVSCDSCPADIDSNGVVDVDDLLNVINNWGVCDACPADVAPPSGNGLIDVDDLLIVINSWGSC